MEKVRKKLEMNSRIQKEKPGKLQVLSVSARQDLNLRSRLPARSGLNAAHRAAAPSTPERGRPERCEVADASAIMPIKKVTHNGG